MEDITSKKLYKNQPTKDIHENKGGERKMPQITPIKVEITLSKIDYLEKTIATVKELKRSYPDITVIIRVQKH